VLRQPEIHDRQEGQDRGQRLGDGQPDLHDLTARRSRPRRSDEGGGTVDEGSEPSTDPSRPDLRGPGTRTIEERWQPRQRPLELGDRRRHDHQGHPDDDRQEEAVDDEDRGSSADG
jgi:hypothetical protein